jgi:hypothetical protein
MKDAVFDALKSRNLKVAEIGETLGKSRQSIYNYVGAYADPSQGSVPAFLHRLFSMCMSSETSQEQIYAFWIAYTKRIKDILQDIESTKISIEDWNGVLDDLNNGKPMEINGITDPAELMAFATPRRDKAVAMLNSLEAELKEERNVLLNRPMSDFDPTASAKVSKLSGPTWQGSGVGTVCVANSGNYMVIVNPESNPGAIETKLKLFTSVDEAQVYLKTMDFEKGSNMIQFSLIPQLVYRYEVIQITESEVKTSGVLDLKNYI